MFSYRNDHSVLYIFTCKNLEVRKPEANIRNFVCSKNATLSAFRKCNDRNAGYRELWIGPEACAIRTSRSFRISWVAFSNALLMFTRWGNTFSPQRSWISWTSRLLVDISTRVFLVELIQVSLKIPKKWRNSWRSGARTWSLS